MKKRRAILALILMVCLIMSGIPQTVFGLPNIDSESSRTIDSELQTVVKHNNNTKKDKHPLQLVGANNTRTFNLGDNVKGVYDSTTKTLTVSGKGAITNSVDRDAWSDVKSIIINDGITSISKNVFSKLRYLNSIKIPNSVTKIDDYTFMSTGLTEITLPNSVTSIGNNAFEQCTALNSVTFPKTKLNIGSSAFKDCVSLKSVTLAKGATNIGDRAFEKCDSLTDVTISEGVASLGNSAFYKCRNLISIKIPNGITSIGGGAFSDCSSLTSITIPKSVTSIGGSAFSECSRLTSITIPSGVTSIGGYTFYNCTGLNSVVISKGVTSIGDSAFYKCTALKSVTIPEGVTSIESRAFSDCDSLTAITIPSSVMNIGSMAFYNCINLGSVENLCNKQQKVDESVLQQAGYRASSRIVSVYSVNTNFIKAAQRERYSVDILDIAGIKVTAPTRVSYIKGEALNLAGGFVTIMYGNGTSKKVDLDSKMISGYNANTLGNQKITVSIKKLTGTFNVTVENKSLASIGITKAPSKTTYIEGENFDSSGMIVTATYSDGSTEVVSGTITNGTNLINGGTAITVSYTRNGITKTVTQPITVIAKKLITSLEITKIPTKTAYIEGENFDSSGMIVTATYSDGSTEVVPGNITNGTNLTKDANSVTVNYTWNGVIKSVTQPITVTTKKLTSIAITKSPTTTTYFKGENFDATGMVLTATYDNGETAEVIGTVDNGNNLSIETKSITISYVENGITKTTTQLITVTTKELSSIAIATAPDKKVYFEGESFDATGMVLTATYNNGRTSVVPGTVANGNNLSLGINNVIISYAENGITKAAIQPITVVPIINEASTTSYALGAKVIGKFDSSTGVLTISGTGDMTDRLSPNSKYSPLYDKRAAIKYLIIENGVTAIGTFNDCENLTTISISDSVTNIPDNAFFNNKSLTSITFGGPITRIGLGALSGCVSLKSIIFSNQVKQIRYKAFYNCTALTSVDFQKGVESIEGSAFENCINLSKIVIPENTISIDDNCFYNCINLKSIINLSQKRQQISPKAFITNAKGELTASGTSYSYSFKKAVLAGGYTWNETMYDEIVYDLGPAVIGKIDKNGTLTVSGTGEMKSNGTYSVFYSNDFIKKIIIEEGVTNIGSSVFDHISSRIPSIVIPNSVTRINGGAFRSTQIDSVVIGKSVDTIEYSAFEDCRIKSIINLYKGKQNFNSSAFNNFSFYTTDYKPVVYAYPENTSFLSCINKNVIILPLTDEHLIYLEVTTTPSKTTYVQGENFDAAGMVVTAIYNDGTKKVVTGTVTNGNNLVSGTNSVNISYTEDGVIKTTTQPINVIAKQINSIAITTAPSKTTYSEGESFDATGMVVTAIYNDGTKKIVTGTVTNGSTLISGTDCVTISYTEDGITKTTTQSINIMPKTLSSIAITTAPSKIVYSEGEDFDITGMILTATYTDGTTAIVNGTVHNGTSLGKRATAIIISYTLNGITKNVGQPITVLDNELKSIAITTMPIKMTYNEGENFDATGMIVTATYRSGRTAVVNGTVTNGNNLTIGTTSVAISYIEKGITKTTTQPIHVTTKQLSSIEITNTPTKIVYNESEKFDATGMVVIATYNNGTTAEVNGMVANGNSLIVGTTSVAISYTENGITKITEQPIIIVPVANAATTSSYALGVNVTGKFDSSTGVLTVCGTGEMSADPYSGGNKSPLSSIKNSIKYIVVENGVTTIGNGHFNGCPNLIAVAIADTVTVIPKNAFLGDKSLTSITLGRFTTKIEGWAFDRCTALTSINLGNTITSIEEAAFDECTSLTSLKLPNSVTNIGRMAFIDSGLTSIILPNSVTSLGDECFRDCANLNSITLSSGMKTIPKMTFYSCKSLTSVTIQNGVTRIGASAFENCTSLPSIVLPKSIIEFEKNSFYNCSKLSNITNLSLIRQTIREQAFKTFTNGHASGTSYNYFFKDVVLQAGYTWTETLYDEVIYPIGPSITGKTNQEGTLTISGTGNMENYTSSYPVLYKNNFIKKIIINEGITNIGDYVFSDISSNISLVVIPDSVTKINQYAFYNTCIDSIVIGKSVNNIGSKAFYGCNIKSIKNLYKGNQNIYSQAFYKSASSLAPTAYMYQENTNFVNDMKYEGFSIYYLTDDYLKSLAVTTTPARTVYMEGENFDSTGMVVTVTYSNGATAIVNGTVTNGENLVEGANSVTISYSENGFTKTTTQPITVISKVLKSIAITTVPTKIVYVEGDDFDDTGMIVTATYSDGSTVAVKGIITNGTLLVKGTTGITISYSKNDITKKVTQPITVIAKELDSIAITTAPTKTDYIEGQNFDATGMVVTATYNNGKTAIVNGTIDNGNNLTVGRDSLKISYNDKGITKTTMISIKVSAKKLSSISVTTAPTKTQYNEGESFDATGMVITAIYNNGTSCSVTGAAIDGAYLMPEANSVTISYTEGGITKTVAQSISVKHKSINKQFSFDCIQGKDLFVPFRVMDTRNLKGTIFTLKYETASLDLIDLVSQTKAIETTAGIVSGTDIEILSYTPGEIKFKVDKDITNGKTWSGTVNIFKFKAKVTEKTGFTAEYN